MTEYDAAEALTTLAIAPDPIGLLKLSRKGLYCTGADGKWDQSMQSASRVEKKMRMKKAQK